MVQTIAPRDSGGLAGMDAQRFRDSGGLTGRETERRYRPPVEPEPKAPDIHFEVGPNGGLPAGIPVEPSTLLFEAADRGFGDIFGEMPSLTGDLKADPMPLTLEGAEQSKVPAIENQPAAIIVTPVPPKPDQASLLQTRRASVDDDQFKAAPTVRMPLTIAEVPSPNGQSSTGEVPQKPFLRRAGSRADEGGLPDFAKAIHSTPLQSTEPDTSLSELAEATGLRRNTGPIDHVSPRSYPSGPLHQNQALDEYPVLIDGHKPTLWSRLRWPVVVMMLLGMLATAGYFLGFQKLIGGGKSEPRQSANVRPTASEAPATANAQSQTETAAKPPETTAKPAEASSPAETPAAVKPEPAPPVAAPPVPAGDVQPTHSLQAASFPSEAGAREFSEKLIRAGVPSYIVSVDIPRRGKWFRIRVGQFPNAGEATKYAAQARQRAKAAGINLDLIVCNYEKP